MADRNLELALKIRALVQGLKDVEGLTNEIEQLADQAGQRIPDPTEGLGEGAERAQGSVLGLRDAYGKLAAAVGVVLGSQVVQAFIEANVAAERLSRGFTAVTGSAEQAAAELQWVRDLSSQLGIDANVAADSLLQLEAATNGTAIAGQKTRDVYSAVVGAMAQLGRSSADTERALTAISQIASKGVVSMEEMRQQLGEALPGAFQALARGLGITVPQLNELIESGNLLAEDALPALANGLGQVTEKVDSYTASWARTKNATDELLRSIGDAGAMDALAGTIETTAKLIDGLNTKLKDAKDSSDALIKRVGESDNEMAAAGARLKAIYGDTAAGLLSVKKNVEGVGNAAKDAGEKAGEAAGKMGDLAGSADTAGQGWTRLSLSIKQADAALEASVGNITKSKDAAVAAAKAEETLADTAGRRGAALEAAARASEAAATGERARADALRTSQGLTQGLVAELQRELASTGQLSAAKQDLLAKLQQEVVEKGKVADAAAANAAKLTAEAEASRLAAQTYGDQSGQLDSLRASYDKAKASVDDLAQSQENGAKAAEKATQIRKALADIEAKIAEATAKAAQGDTEAAKAVQELLAVTGTLTQELERLEAVEQRGIEAAGQMAEARKAQAEAEALYADALKDSAAQSDRAAKAAGAEGDLRQKSLEVQKAQAEAMRDLAEARGDEAGQLEAANDLRQIEAELAAAAAESRREEAEALREKATYLRELANSQAEYNQEMDDAARAAENAARAAELEADALDAVAKGQKAIAEEGGAAAAEQERLAEAMGAMASEAEGAELAIAGLGDNLEELNEKLMEGVISVDEYKESLQELKDEAKRLEEIGASVGVAYEDIFRQVGNDFGKFRQINQGLAKIPGALQKAWEDYQAWLREQGLSIQDEFDKIRDAFERTTNEIQNVGRVGAPEIRALESDLKASRVEARGLAGDMRAVADVVTDYDWAVRVRAETDPSVRALAGSLQQANDDAKDLEAMLRRLNGQSVKVDVKLTSQVSDELLRRIIREARAY